jgi:hypothetical protein
MRAHGEEIAVRFFAAPFTATVAADPALPETPAHPTA